MRSEKADVALRVLEAIDAQTPIPEKDAFQLRYWVSTEEALLPLESIARLILLRESNSKTAEPD
jgi:hypothetical protein